MRILAIQFLLGLYVAVYAESEHERTVGSVDVDDEILLTSVSTTVSDDTTEQIDLTALGQECIDDPEGKECKTPLRVPEAHLGANKESYEDDDSTDAKEHMDVDDVDGEGIQRVDNEFSQSRDDGPEEGSDEEEQSQIPSAFDDEEEDEQTSKQHEEIESMDNEIILSSMNFRENSQSYHDEDKAELKKKDEEDNLSVDTTEEEMLLPAENAAERSASPIYDHDENKENSENTANEDEREMEDVSEEPPTDSTLEKVSQMLIGDGAASLKTEGESDDQMKRHYDDGDDETELFDHRSDTASLFSEEVAEGTYDVHEEEVQSTRIYQSVIILDEEDEDRTPSGIYGNKGGNDEKFVTLEPDGNEDNIQKHTNFNLRHKVASRRIDISRPNSGNEDEHYTEILETMRSSSARIEIADSNEIMQSTTRFERTDEGPPVPKDLSDPMMQLPPKKEEHCLSKCETYLDAMEHHLEQLVIDCDRKERLVKTELDQELSKLQAHLEREQGISLQRSERLTECEHTLTSVERHFRNQISEHEKNHSVADTTVVHLRSQIAEMQKQIELRLKAFQQSEDRLAACQKSTSETKDHYETLIVELERDHSKAITSLVQAHKEETEVLKRLVDSEQRTFWLVEERSATCEKNLKAMEKHLEIVITDHAANQSIATTTLLQLREQVAELKRQNSLLEERTTTQTQESVASCEISLSSREIQFHAVISELERNNSLANANVLQLQQHAIELQRELSTMERRSLDALEESRRVREREREALLVQAAKNLSTIESQWQRRYLSLREKHVRSQQNHEKRQQEFESLLDQYYTTRQEMFAAYRTLRELQSHRASGNRLTTRIATWILACWERINEALAAGAFWISARSVEAANRVTQLQIKIRGELEATGIFALLAWFENHVLIAVFHHLKTSVFVNSLSMPHLEFRMDSLPGLSRCLQIRQQLHDRLANTVRAVSQLVLALCHVTNVGSSIAFAVSFLEWSYRNSNKFVQRAELVLLLITVGFLAKRIKVHTFFLRGKKEPGRQGDWPAAIAPTKIRPAFRKPQQKSHNLVVAPNKQLQKSRMP